MASKSFICSLLLLLFHFNHASSTNHPLCHEHESSALLNFKNSFFIRKSASIDGAHPKIESWNLRSREGRDCCNWDGVECHKTTGYVIGLDISKNYLYGSIHSNSGLFQLVHLRSLNLAYNDFNGSEIPSAIGRLSRLTHLNLSISYFSGQIPPQVLQLFKLVSLDLSANPVSGAMLQNPGLKTLVQNLPFLRILHLNYVNMSSTVPQVLANLSYLTSIRLKGCNLQGEFPSSIFNLPHLQQMSIRYNPNLTGFFPEVNPGNRLQRLWLGSTGFIGKLPASIENLKSLEMLDIRHCGFTGFLPASMGNLTKLTFLDLSFNSFYNHTIPSWLGKLTQLRALGLDDIDLRGEIPSFISNLTQLNFMNLWSNQLTGNLPLELCRLTKLYILDMSHNNLSGIIPPCFGNLSSSLVMLYLNNNNFHGRIPQTFGSPCQLRGINFSRNRLRGRLPRSLANCPMLEILKYKGIVMS